MRYIKSLAHPGGNLTGVFLDLPELSGKQVGLLKEMVPGLSHIAIFGIRGLNAAQFAAAAAAVRAVGIEPRSQLWGASDPNSLFSFGGFWRSRGRVHF